MASQACRSISMRCSRSISLNGSRIPARHLSQADRDPHTDGFSLLEKDDRTIYSGVTSKELMLSLLNLHLIAYDSLVDASINVLKSPLLKHPVLRQPILSIAKRTVYAHFCAGGSTAEASDTLHRMWELGLRSILNYSQEDATDNAACDHNLKCFLQAIHRIPELPAKSVSFFGIKITALTPISLLEHVSTLLRWQHKHPNLKLPWKEDVIPLLADESPSYLVQSSPEPLSAMDENDFILAKRRLWILCQACEDAGIPLLVDAEYMVVQPAIDYLTYLAMAEWNKRGQYLVYGTIQAYLKDALPRLSFALEGASKRGVQFGVKLVRGAYMTRENALAAFMGADPPIHPNIQQTHTCYDNCAAFVMEHAATEKAAILIATHNFDSGKKAVAKAHELGLRKENPRLQFAQLKGMADRFSLALAHAGFQVSKYVPFGPVADVIPYLIRRAEENRGLLGNTLSDRLHIRQELKRRILFQ